MSKFLRGNLPEHLYGTIVQVQPTSKATSQHLGISRLSLQGKKFKAAWGSWTYTRLSGGETCKGTYLIDGELENGKYFQLTDATIEVLDKADFKENLE